MDDIEYWRRRCADHQTLARQATCLPVIRAHLAFVRAYQSRVADAEHSALRLPTSREAA